MFEGIFAPDVPVRIECYEGSAIGPENAPATVVIGSPRVLAGAAPNFEAGRTHIHQVLAVKAPGGRSGMPLRLGLFGDARSDSRHTGLRKSLFPFSRWGAHSSRSVPAKRR